MKHLHLNAFVMPNGHHEAAWRHPSTDPHRAATLRHYVDIARTAERGKLDSLFLADGVALWGHVRYNSHTLFEPLTLLSALAGATERIGLIATASTTYNEPYHLARKFASLDHLSGGRAGWNIVTSAGEDEARNFNRDARPSHALRYERATEFVEVAKKLWDSWDDGAAVVDKATGVYADTDRIHPIDHDGPHFQVRGPLNIPRPVQGHPLLVQAGSSETGKEYAARFAEAVFTAQQTFADGKAFYDDVKGRLAKYGRSPDEIKILPGISPILGRTEAEAKEREAELNALITPAYGVRQLSTMLDHDLTPYPLDGPLPDVGAFTEGAQSRFELVTGLARRENLTIRQLIERLAGGRGHRVFAGTATQVADQLELWFTEGAADGFNVMPPTLPGGLEDFVDLVVPELQKRGLFRTEYTATTLRGHYGLARPVTRTRVKEHAA
ncbi:LLM class flavin-dependent oxidoreductase [Amycolatopsis roodepoortensis]|uniref:FMN-dependent oxidoreductase (Nitrilotriacetate monooxygenase family) n=1 Tax=Amycolatopsis roodepoortensis TaxID=700274 RepID=A0ABR9LEW2_9PSEU|nr:LLM class flavin-dependent oxidoreductase [Amycolatopsis roodepoortensis]MBE1579067.1 FMN-dependent oxidoreductase (nitrilotriacetate monooxygenase family) [Amycolatopsis roodepoortensis]